MKTSTIKTFTVFYAWQSDIDQKINRYFIAKALKAALLDLSSTAQDQEIQLEIDEATRGTSGSPNIPLTILSKIAASDAFVCDITTINSRSPKIHRRVPNPNVVFELGYAVAILGWPRIVLVFNEAHGSLKTDVPFDFDRHRITRYSAIDSQTIETAQSQALKTAQASLARTFKVAIEMIVNSNPTRPASSFAISEHQRDIDTLRYLLTQLHIPTLEEHSRNMPFRLSDRALYFWDGFHEMWTSNLTHVYDANLRNILEGLHNAWHVTVSYDNYYHPVRGDYYIFGTGEDLYQSPGEEMAYSCIKKATLALMQHLTNLCEKIRKDFVEINLLETNADAWRRYKSTMARITKTLKRGSHVDLNGSSKKSSGSRKRRPGGG